MFTLTPTNIKKTFATFSHYPAKITNQTASKFEEVVFTPNSADNKILLNIKNQNVLGKSITLQFESTNGDKLLNPIVVTDASDCFFIIDTAYIQKKDGTVKIRVSPPDGSSLTSCDVSMSVVNIKA